MPPSTRRVRHIPSWVDEGLLLSGAAAAGARDSLEDARCSSSSHLLDDGTVSQLRHDGTEVGSAAAQHRATISNYVVGWLMAHRSDATGGPPACAALDGDDAPPPPPRALHCVRDCSGGHNVGQTDAMIALQHCLQRADDDRTQDSVVFCSPDDPLDAVSRYHSNTNRQSKADIHATFEDAKRKPGAAAAAGATATNQQKGMMTAAATVIGRSQAGSTDDIGGSGGGVVVDGASSLAVAVSGGSPRFNARHDGGAPSEEKDAPSGPTQKATAIHSQQQQCSAASVGLPMHDLMLQLAARGAISEDTLREFMAFKPVTVNTAGRRVTVTVGEASNPAVAPRRFVHPSSPPLWEGEEGAGISSTHDDDVPLVPLLSRRRPTRSDGDVQTRQQTTTRALVNTNNDGVRQARPSPAADKENGSRPFCEAPSNNKRHPPASAASLQRNHLKPPPVLAAAAATIAPGFPGGASSIPLFSVLRRRSVPGCGVAADDAADEESSAFLRSVL